MFNYLDMEFVQALNPLYAFPIVAVILCAFIVYAFGFKSPVQPPSFEGIEEEKKVSKKRKSKETSKQGKAVQNGKLNGSTVNKPHISPPGKKKDVEKVTSIDKAESEKSTITEKKASKKTKSQNEKRNIQEKKKETFVNEDASEDGWVHLVSKKGRKSRRKDEIILTENQSKSVKISELGKSDESTPSDESLEKTEFSVQSSVEKAQPVFKEEKLRKKESANEVNKPSLKEEKSKKKEGKEEKTALGVPSNTEISKEKVEVNIKVDSKILEKLPSKENMKSGKLIEESSNKSKKKKKKNAEINTDNESLINISEPPPLQGISELPVKNAAIDSAVVVQTSQVVNSEIEENQTKVSKSSNVVFDELAGLYPEATEQRKKRRVRRDQ